VLGEEAGDPPRGKLDNPLSQNEESKKILQIEEHSNSLLLIALCGRKYTLIRDSYPKSAVKKVQARDMREEGFYGRSRLYLTRKQKLHSLKGPKMHGHMEVMRSNRDSSYEQREAELLHNL